jgi:hypothetical protein
VRKSPEFEKVKSGIVARPDLKTENQMSRLLQQRPMVGEAYLLASATSMLVLSCANAALSKVHLDSYNNFEVKVDFAAQSGDLAQLEVAATALNVRYQSGALLPANNSPFIAFSLSVPDRLSHSEYWDSASFGSGSNEGGQPGAPWFNPDGIFRVASLYEHYAGDVSFADHHWTGKQEGAALQLAIWDVLYGDGNTVNNPHSAFYISKGDPLLIAMANQILSASANWADPELKVSFWSSVGRTESEHGRFDAVDFIGPFTGAVPEPGTYAAGIAACGYFWFASRGHRTRKRR